VLALTQSNELPRHASQFRAREIRAHVNEWDEAEGFPRSSSQAATIVFASASVIRLVSAALKSLHLRPGSRRYSPRGHGGLLASLFAHRSAAADLSRTVVE